jgi:hypothetical protein
MGDVLIKFITSSALHLKTHPPGKGITGQDDKLAKTSISRWISKKLYMRGV